MYTSHNFKLSYHETLVQVFTRRLHYENMNAKEDAFVREQLAYHEAELLRLKPQAPVMQMSIIKKEQSSLLPMLQTN